MNLINFHIYQENDPYIDKYRFIHFLLRRKFFSKDFVLFEVSSSMDFLAGH